jgi:hypothetical protein
MNASLTCKIPDEINGPCLINCLCALFQIDELLSYGINVTVYNGQVTTDYRALTILLGA